MTTRGLETGSSSDLSPAAIRRTKSGAAVPPPVPAQSSQQGVPCTSRLPPKP